MTKILIVDDNSELGTLLQWTLEEEGHEVKWAKDGKEGYFAYLLFEPEIVLTDIQMPEKNGFELIELIRCHNPKTRVIFMSGNVNQFQSSLREEIEKYHARVLEKPFTKEELIRLISN
ncbi:MAG: response regulator [Treponemataceae bacterium]|nr:response regulator [Treponemataceae bacterium]